MDEPRCKTPMAERQKFQFFAFPSTESGRLPLTLLIAERIWHRMMPIGGQVFSSRQG